MRTAPRRHGPFVRRLARCARAPGCAALAALLALAATLLAPAAATPVAAAPGDGTAAYGCNGGTPESYTVPDAMTQLAILAGGAAGGNADDGRGGKGGTVQAVVPVSPGYTYSVLVGCAGRGTGNGSSGSGGAGYGGGGGAGGHSDFHFGGAGGGGSSAVYDPNAFAFPLVLAGAGGGGGGHAFAASGGNGGDGSQHGQHGQSGGGAGSAAGGAGGDARAAGVAAETGWKSVGGGGGGGGGGGYNGGGGGHGGSCDSCGGGGGGGGSSFVEPGATKVTYTMGNVDGDGYVVIVPLKAWNPVPSTTIFGCENGHQASYTVPPNVRGLTVLAGGADGGTVDRAAQPGKGALVRARVPVTSGATLGVVAGCSGDSQDNGGKGYGAGGAGGVGFTTDNGDGSGGGGGSALLDAAGNPLVVAGGGGGGGGKGTLTKGGHGGDGSQAGQRGAAGVGALGGGGGLGGSERTSRGAGGGNGVDTGGGAGGGGGGGGYQGGKGGSGGGVASGGGGGGGGSSFVTVVATDVTYTSGGNDGSGLVVLVAAPDSVPDPPLRVQAAGGNAQATVDWDPPADWGGEVITSYTVTSHPDNVTATTNQTGVIVTGLTNGTTYTFTVTATNGVGTSVASVPSNAVTPLTVPGAPTVTTVAANVRAATVDFSPPASTGGSPITSYTVTASPGGATASGPSSPITVTGLANGGTYTFTVVATSAVGTGPASAASAAVTLPSLPGAPTIGSATATGNGQVSVAFTPPTFTSGIPIRSYTVTSTPNGITATGTSSPIAISGLPTNNYTFTVHATTVVGDGPESAASNVVKPYPPLPPQAVFARPGNTRVQLSWVAPSDTAGPTTSYTIVGSPGGLTMTVPPPAVGQDGVTSPVTVTGLTNGTTYTFTVAATNLAGTGQASLPSNTVTPQATSAPANDNIATAQAITGDSGSVSGSNVNASLEPGEPQINGNPGGSSIWYAWTPATGGGSATITTCGSSFPAILGVYRITDPTSPVSVTNIQSVFPSAGTVTCPGGLTTASSVQFDLPLTGGTFYIQVDGNNTGSGAPTGSVTLNWTK